VAAVKFGDAFGGQLRAKKNRTRAENRILKIIDGPESAARTWFLAKLEGHARVQLGVGPNQAIDWGSIDWSKVLDILMKIASIIVMLAPLFAAKPKTKTAPKSRKGLGRTLTRKRL